MKKLLNTQVLSLAGQLQSQYKLKFVSMGYFSQLDFEASYITEQRKPFVKKK